MPDYITVCEKAARAAGAVLKEKLGQAAVREKGPRDLVTEADFAAQEILRDTVLTTFPGHGFQGEEDDPDAPPTEGTPEFRWIADPLDGTTNYVHQVPHFCVSLALARGEELLVGAVFNPMTEECYLASAGKGAYLNGRRLTTSDNTRLSQSLGGVGFPAVVGPDSPDLVVFLEAIPRFQALRRTGSAALNLGYVAAGRLEVAWAYCTKAWDVAAGTLLVREAGGIVTAPDGGGSDGINPQFIASANPQLHEQILQIVAQSKL